MCSGLCHSESLHIRTSRGVPEQSTRNMPCPVLLWYSKVRISFPVVCELLNLEGFALLSHYNPRNDGYQLKSLTRILRVDI